MHLAPWDTHLASWPGKLLWDMARMETVWFVAWEAVPGMIQHQGVGTGKTPRVFSVNAKRAGHTLHGWPSVSALNSAIRTLCTKGSETTTAMVEVEVVGA